MAAAVPMLEDGSMQEENNPRELAIPGAVAKATARTTRLRGAPITDGVPTDAGGNPRRVEMPAENRTDYGFEEVAVTRTPYGPMRSVAIRERMSVSEASLRDARARLEASDNARIIATEELQTALREFAAREQWWRRGVQDLEHGVRGHWEDRDRLVETAEQGWQEQQRVLEAAIRSSQAEAQQQRLQAEQMAAEIEQAQ